VEIVYGTESNQSRGCKNYAAGISDPNVQRAIEAIIKACETFAHDINVLYADVDEIERRLGLR
jgi:hypothetical protein